MKQFLIIIFILISTLSYSQIDHKGNPVFNSIQAGEDTISDFNLISNYYPLKTNIENKSTAVFISENPTLDEVLDAATKLPSDFFLIMKGQNVIKMILINNFPTKYFFVINPNTRKGEKYKSPLKGDITENRANDLIKEKYDTTAYI